MVIQKFVTDIVEKGEWCLMFFNKRYSHTVNRISVDGGSQGFLHGFGTRQMPVPENVKKVARKVMAAVQENIIYARVDVMEEGNHITLVELEVIEPSLFLGHDSNAPEKFAEAIMCELQKTLSSIYAVSEQYIYSNKVGNNVQLFKSQNVLY